MSRSWRRLSPWLIVFLLLTAGCSSRERQDDSGSSAKSRPPAPGESRPAAPSTPPASGPVEVAFPRHISDRCDNLLFVGDVLPHLVRLLSSEPLRDALLDGSLARALPPGGPPLDPQLLLPYVTNSARFIPTESVIAMPSASLEDLAHLAKMGLLVGLCNGAIEAGRSQTEADLPKLHDLLLEEIEGLEVPELTIWVRFREPGVATQLMMQLRQVVRQLARQPAIEVTEQADVLRLKARLGGLAAPEELALILFTLGVATDPEEPNLTEMAEQLAQLSFEVRLEQIDDGLRLTTGPAADGPACDTEQLGPLFKPEIEMLAFGRWNTGPLTRGLSDVWETWQQWEDTPTGRATKASDSEDMLGDLKLILRQLERAAPEGTMNLRVGESIEAVVHSHGLPPASTLGESRILELVPSGAEVVMLDTTSSAADHVSDQFSDFEDRLATKSLQWELSGKTTQAEMAEKVTQFYYTEMAEFRKLIHERSHEVFKPPHAVFLGSQGHIARLAIRFEYPPGTPYRITLRDAPMIEYAVVGRPSDPARAGPFVAQVWNAFLKAFYEGTPPQSTERIDLGLGVDTFGFPGDFWSRLPGKMTVAVEGDLLPHYFVEDGWFVFSTSKRLSRQILDAKRGGPAERLAIPAQGGQELVGYGRVPASTLANYLDIFGQLLGDFLANRGRFHLEGPVFDEPPPAGADQIGAVMRGMGELIKLVDRFEWRTFDQADYRETRFEVILAE